MNKFYVRSGELNVVILAEDAKSAVINSLENHGSEKEIDGYLFWVSEQGFNDSDAHTFRVDDLLEELGYIDEEEEGFC